MKKRELKANLKAVDKFNTIEEIISLISELTDDEKISLLISTIVKLKKENLKQKKYIERLLREKFKTTSERCAKIDPKLDDEAKDDDLNKEDNTSSEKLKDGNKPKLNFEGKDTTVKAKRGRKEGSKNITDDPIIQKILESGLTEGVIDNVHFTVQTEDVEDDNCPLCGSKLKSLGNALTVKKCYVPGYAKYTIILKPKKICSNPECGKSYEESIDDPFPKSDLGSSLICEAIYDKYVLGLPTNRLARECNRDGVKVGYNPLMKWMMNTGEKMIPLADLMMHQAFKTDGAVHIDETHFKLIHPGLKDGKPRLKSHIFAIVSDQIKVFVYTDGGRDTKWLQELIDEEFGGKIVTDAFKGYNFVEKNGKVHQLCLDHARRKFFYAYLAASDEIRDTEACVSRKCLLLFREIFLLERNIKGKSKEEIIEYRNSELYKSKIKDLRDFVDSIIPYQDTLLEKAVNYLKNHWDGLFTYVEYEIPCHNMAAEILIKTLAAIRASSLNFNNPRTAKINCALLTITQTAIDYGLDVYRYFNYIIHYIGKVDLEDLLPWSPNLFKLDENYDI